LTSATSELASSGVDETPNCLVVFGVDDAAAEAVWPAGGEACGQLCGTTVGSGWRHGRSTAAAGSGRAAAAATSAHAAPKRNLLC
jgi:hypothetical protein